MHSTPPPDFFSSDIGKVLAPVTLYAEKTQKNIIDSSLTKGVKWKLKHEAHHTKSPRRHNYGISRSNYFSFQFFIKDLESLPWGRGGEKERDRKFL